MRRSEDRDGSNKAGERVKGDEDGDEDDDNHLSGYTSISIRLDISWIFLKVFNRKFSMKIFD